MLKVNFQVHSCRRIPCPFGKDTGVNPRKTYQLMVNMKHLPMNMPTECNPRDLNLNTFAAKEIRRGLLTRPEIFHLCNRGLDLSAAEVLPVNKSSRVVITFSDYKRHGVMNGRHTYEIIGRNMPQQDVYVPVRVHTGIEADFPEIVLALNTSVQLELKSVANLRGCYGFLKDALEGVPWLDDVSWKQNEPGGINVVELVAVGDMFLNNSPSFMQPYTAKGKCHERYVRDYGPYVKLLPVFKDLFVLYDMIEQNFGKWYNYDGKRIFGRIAGVTRKKVGDEFKEFYLPKFGDGVTKLNFALHLGFIYPILSAFKGLLTIDDKPDSTYHWLDGVDVFDFAHVVGPNLVHLVVDEHEKLKYNSNAVGKSSALWISAYYAVQKAFKGTLDPLFSATVKQRRYKHRGKATKA